MYKMKREKQKRDILKIALEKIHLAALSGDLEAVRKLSSTCKSDYERLLKSPIKRKRKERAS